MAADLGAQSIAFPLISAGAYGWPVDDAAGQALGVLRAAQPRHVKEARFVLFGDQAYTIANRLWHNGV